MKVVRLITERTARRELDREQDALIEGKGRGLGLMGEWKGVPNYHGGRIQQKLRLNKGSAGYYLTPEPLEMTRSYRFARYMGSRRLLQIRLDEKLLQQERDEIAEFLARDFVICGRVFRPFTSKEESVYLVETTRNYERKARKSQGDHLRISYCDFIKWHNPMDRNFGQVTYWLGQ